MKILWIKKREYRDGIKSRETRPGWGEAHNVYKTCVGTTEGFYANMRPILQGYLYSLCS